MLRFSFKNSPYSRMGMIPYSHLKIEDNYTSFHCSTLLGTDETNSLIEFLPDYDYPYECIFDTQTTKSSYFILEHNKRSGESMLIIRPSDDLTVSLSKKIVRAYVLSALNTCEENHIVDVELRYGGSSFLKEIMKQFQRLKNKFPTMTFNFSIRSIYVDDKFYKILTKYDNLIDGFNFGDCMCQTLDIKEKLLKRI